MAPVRTAFPRDVKDPLVIRVDNENSQPVVSLAVTVADGRPARADVAHRPDDRQGARERSRRRAHRRQRPRHAPDPDPDQARGADRARHRRRPGHERHPRREPGRAGRPHHPRRQRRGRARRRQDQGPGAVRARHRRPAGRAAPVYLSQVADVIDGEKEPDSISRINGHPAITLDIQKAQDANIVETGRSIRAAVATLKARLPSDVDLRIIYSNADEVQSSVDRVKSTILEGGAADRADRVPVPAQLAQHDHHRADAADRRRSRRSSRCYAFGFTLNFLTLMALSLCIGLLIDDAIVVRENIVRHLAHGQGPRDRSAGGHRRDRARRDGDDVRDRRRVRADRVHERHHRSLLLPVRRHRRRRGAGVAVRQLHARPDALVGMARPAGLAFQARAMARTASWTVDRAPDRWLHAIYADASFAGRSVIARRCSRSRSAASSRASCIVPLVGTEFIPEVDQGFISLRLNTAGRLEPRVHRHAKVAEVEAGR